MQKITIAGTSFGGSSYMARLVRAYHNTGLVVEVTKGVKQRTVIEEIRRCINDLNRFSGKPLVIKVVPL